MCSLTSSINFSDTYFRLVPATIRANISHVVLFRPTNNKEIEAIYELFPITKNEMYQLIEFVFDKKYNFLFIDLSLKESSSFRFFKNFDKIVM